jgi:hypothetical protein
MRSDFDCALSGYESLQVRGRHLRCVKDLKIENSERNERENRQWKSQRRSSSVEDVNANRGNYERNQPHLRRSPRVIAGDDACSEGAGG